MARPKTDFKNFRLRLHPAMYQQIQDAAEAANRSMNVEIIYRLGETLDPRWAQYVAALEEAERRDREMLEAARQDPALMEEVRRVVERAKQEGRLEGKKPKGS